KKAGFAPATTILGKAKELPKERDAVFPLAFGEERVENVELSERAEQRSKVGCLNFDSYLPGPARIVPTTGGQHLSIRSRAVTGSPITPNANFNSPNQGSSRVVIVDSYKDIE
ncbi:hypothetical protein HAX54_039094, partial [Datura stramonium]|nr:hypothetical protein [Datura stramonium]